jgi:hypothetical protein
VCKRLSRTVNANVVYPIQLTWNVTFWCFVNAFLTLFLFFLILCRCQKRDWEENHNSRCVDYQKKMEPFITGEPIQQVAVAMNPACGRCRVSPIRDAVVLPECQHGFCFSCLKDAESSGTQNGSITCPMCNRVSSNLLEEGVKEGSEVEGILLHRAREFQRNAVRVDATQQERKENLAWALAEISKIPSPVTSQESDFLYYLVYRETKILLLIQSGEYQKAVDQCEAQVLEIKDAQLPISESSLGIARERHELSSLSVRYVIDSMNDCMHNAVRICQNRLLTLHDV